MTFKFAQRVIAVASMLLLPLCPAGPLAAGAAANLPPWRTLEFEGRSLWGTAQARIEFRQKSRGEVDGNWRNPGHKAYLLPHAAEVWEIKVFSTVGSNQAQLHLLMEPGSAAMLQRNRFTIGRSNRRNKFYRYHARGVTRIRQDPLRHELDLPPQQWSESTVQEIGFPDLPAGSVVTSPYALLALVTTTALAIDESVQFFVHTDYNLYEVNLRRGKNSRLEANYLLHGKGDAIRRYRESREVEVIQVRVEATSQAPDEPDFELLGLGGELSLLLDVETRLPLRVIGAAPRIGEAHLDLSAASLLDDGGTR